MLLCLDILLFFTHMQISRVKNLYSTTVTNRGGNTLQKVRKLASDKKLSPDQLIANLLKKGKINDAMTLVLRVIELAETKEAKLIILSIPAEFFMNTQVKGNEAKALKKIMNEVIANADLIDANHPITLLLKIRYDLLKNIHGLDQSWAITKMVGLGKPDKQTILKDLDRRLLDLEQHEAIYASDPAFKRQVNQTLDILQTHAKSHHIELPHLAR